MKQLFKKCESGVSLIEMIVAMFIIGILAVLILANYRASQKRQVFTMATQQFISDLRKTQNMAISGSGVSGAGYAGYGIYAKNNSASYTIFGDKNNNQKFNVGNEEIQVVDLPAKVKIASVSPMTNGRINVFFMPPAPTTFINGVPAAGTPAVFILQTDDVSLSRAIVVTAAGMISD